MKGRPRQTQFSLLLGHNNLIPGFFRQLVILPIGRKSTIYFDYGEPKINEHHVQQLGQSTRTWENKPATSLLTFEGFQPTRRTLWTSWIAIKSKVQVFKTAHKQVLMSILTLGLIYTAWLWLPHQHKHALCNKSIIHWHVIYLQAVFGKTETDRGLKGKCWQAIDGEKDQWGNGSESLAQLKYVNLAVFKQLVFRHQLVQLLM